MFRKLLLNFFMFSFFGFIEISGIILWKAIVFVFFIMGEFGFQVWIISFWIMKPCWCLPHRQIIIYKIFAILLHDLDLSLLKLCMIIQKQKHCCKLISYSFIESFILFYYLSIHKSHSVVWIAFPVSRLNIHKLIEPVFRLLSLPYHLFLLDVGLLFIHIILFYDVEATTITATIRKPVCFLE